MAGTSYFPIGPSRNAPRANAPVNNNNLINEDVEDLHVVNLSFLNAPQGNRPNYKQTKANLQMGIGNTATQAAVPKNAAIRSLYRTAAPSRRPAAFSTTTVRHKRHRKNTRKQRRH